MAVLKIRCLSCFDKFIVPSLNDVPSDCPLCGAFINSKKMPDVAMPFIPLRGGEKTRIIDRVYRDAEASSEVRMQQAAAMTPGASASDFSHLKVTDYRSGMVEGESAVPLPQLSREFRQNSAALQGAGVAVQPSGGINITAQAAQFAAQSGAGPEPFAGARAMKRLRSVHSQSVDPRMATAVTSYPTMAERQPGFKPRA